MTETKHPGVLTGALVGLLLTAPLLALFFLGAQLIGLPLVPLDFFDFLVPLIPGDLVTLGIDAMVDTLIGLGFGENVDSIAKVLEQGMAYVFLLGMGVIVGAAVFAISRNMAQRAYIVGAVAGVLLGAAFTAMSLNNLQFVDANPVFAGIWVFTLFVAWGVAMGWLFTDLSELPDKTNPVTEGDMPPANVQQMGRREFLVRVGGATATLTLVGAGLGLALGGEDDTATTATVADGGESATDATTADANRLPNADADVQPAPGMRPEYTPVEEHYRIDIASRPLEIDGATWTLPFTGLIAANREFTMEELRSMPSREEYVTMQCISNRIGGNLISTTKWTGVPVRDVLKELEIEPEGQWLRIEGGDGFFEYVNIEMCMQDERIMFTYDFDDDPLPNRNGFPLRIYIPERYGMKQPKWIIGIEVVEEDEQGYWVRRSWSADAIMQTTSVVDTIATNDLYRDEDGNIRVPVGGYAMSSTRGISKVEVSVDGGEWVEAQLRDPISDKTWVFWRYDWLFEAGDHEFAVRCYEGDGTLQPTEAQGVRPDGATGIHSASAEITNTLDSA